MQINLSLTRTGEPKKTVVAKAPEFVAFESEFNISVSALEKEFRYTHLCFFAWHVEKRTGVTQLDFAEWVNGVEEVEAEPVKK